MRSKVKTTEFLMTEGFLEQGGQFRIKILFISNNGMLRRVKEE